jgi:hypothetical protein
VTTLSTYARQLLLLATQNLTRTTALSFCFYRARASRRSNAAMSVATKHRHRARDRTCNPNVVVFKPLPFFFFFFFVFCFVWQCSHHHLRGNTANARLCRGAALRDPHQTLLLFCFAVNSYQTTTRPMN